MAFSASEISKNGTEHTLVEIFNGQMTSTRSPQTKDIRQEEEGVECEQP